jgi:TM2 domain-containing membrane protein YozV
MDAPTSPKSRLIALLLVIFVGMFGVHNFYVGKTRNGVIQLVLTVTVLLSWVTAIWVFVDFIMILLGTFTDAQKRAVRDWEHLKLQPHLLLLQNQ